MATVRRWAAILRIVIATRAILPIFQLRCERAERAHANDRADAMLGNLTGAAARCGIKCN